MSGADDETVPHRPHDEFRAGKIVLHLAQRDPAVDREVSEVGIVEVRRRE